MRQYSQALPALSRTNLACFLATPSARRQLPQRSPGPGLQKRNDEPDPDIGAQLVAFPRLELPFVVFVHQGLHPSTFLAGKVPLQNLLGRGGGEFAPIQDFQQANWIAIS